MVRQVAVAVVAVLALMALSLAPAAGAASAAPAVACTLLSPAQLHAILGFSQSRLLRNYDKTVYTGPTASEAVNTECDAGVWSGPTPTTPQGMLQTAKSGHAAQVGIETWAPNDAGPNVKNWLHTDYDTLTGGFMVHSFTFPGIFATAGWPAQRLKTPGYGDNAAGFKVAVQGLGKGLVAAIGCWWNDKTYSAICIFDEEAASHPVVTHLNELAKVAVPRFL